jgi:hypothetical protein
MLLNGDVSTAEVILCQIRLEVDYEMLNIKKRQEAIYIKCGHGLEGQERHEKRQP